MEERISGIYNDCWKIYKQYLQSRDMEEWNRNTVRLNLQYECEPDISGLLYWFSCRVQTLHDRYMRERRSESGRSGK